MIAAGSIALCVVLLVLAGRTTAGLDRDPVAPVATAPAPASAEDEQEAIRITLRRALLVIAQSPAPARRDPALAASRLRAGIPGLEVTGATPSPGELGIRRLGEAIEMCLGTQRRWICVVRSGGTVHTGLGETLGAARSDLPAAVR